MTDLGFLYNLVHNAVGLLDCLRGASDNAHPLLAAIIILELHSSIGVLLDAMDHVALLADDDAHRLPRHLELYPGRGEEPFRKGSG